MLGTRRCLDVGMQKAVALAREFDKPVFGVHHMEAHALMPLLTHSEAVKYPFAALLLSGGHTLLALCRSVGSFTVIGSTLDDALGEAMDKVWRLVSSKVADLPPAVFAVRWPCG